MLAGRRGLLALPAASCAASGPVAAREHGPMRARLATLQLGANLERWFPVARDGRPRRLGRRWWRDFRAAGFDHARMFLPEVGKTGGGTEIPALFAQAVEDAVEAGLPVLLGMSDFHYQNPAWGAADWAALRTRAEWFAPRTDPGMVVLAAINEPIFDDVESWLPVRDRMLGVMRRAAPRHLLMWGGREWCSARSLLECTPPADPGTIAEVHDYQGGDSAEMARRFGAVAAWRERTGLPVVFAELGGTLQQEETDRVAWAASLARSLPLLREMRFPAALWSYSHGTHWRIQAGEDPAPQPDLLRGFLPGR